LLNRIRKWRHIDTTIGKSGWDELLDRTLEAADQFQRLISSVPAGAERTNMNFAVGTIIESLGMGKTLTYKVETFFDGAGKRTWADLLKEHRDSRDWIEEMASKPVSSLRKNSHHLYGQINAREWMALTIRHYDYHTKQINRILATERYKTAARMASESRRATG
jgi:hypothetical protein